MQYAFIDKASGSIDLIIEKNRVYSTIEIVDNGIGFDINNVRKNSLRLSRDRTTIGHG